MTIHTLTNKAIAVTGLPEGMIDINIQNATATSLQIIIGTMDKCIIENMTLPAGNWTILGRAAKLTEEDWKQVVPYELIGGIGGVGMQWLYPDYERSNCDGYELALQSGHSLLKAKGLHVTNPLMSEKPITVIGHKGQEKICELILERFQEQWQSAELLTNPLILINEQRIWQKENKPV